MSETIKDLYSEVAQWIVGDLSTNANLWQRPNVRSDIGLPTRVTGVRFRGINVLLLWSEAIAKEFQSSVWLTYEQAKSLGGYVRRGERGSTIVYEQKCDDAETGEPSEQAAREVFETKRYTLFNLDQIEGLQKDKRPAEASLLFGDAEPTQAIETFVRATQAVVAFDAEEVWFSAPEDKIMMLPVDRFDGMEAHSAALLRQLIHWTGHETRLARTSDAGKPALGVAAEDLVAELGAAFLCAELGVPFSARSDHAARLEDWSAALNNDPRAIFRFAAEAQRAVDFLKGFQTILGAAPSPSFALAVSDEAAGGSAEATPPKKERRRRSPSQTAAPL